MVFLKDSSATIDTTEMRCEIFFPTRLESHFNPLVLIVNVGSTGPKKKGQLHMTTNENNITPLYRIAFPYCIQKQEDGSYLLFNREYKPIGFRFKVLREDIIRKISVDGDPSDRAIYLYGDGSKPTQNKENMEDYLERLSVLMSLKVE